ncbi:MAG TPA: hypothetical protein VIS05_08395 [Ilumatobacter sp.]
MNDAPNRSGPGGRDGAVDPVPAGGLGWLSPRQRDGGIDRVPLPAATPGELWLCGKHAIAPLAATPDAIGWTTVVCLVERHELTPRYPHYVAWLDAGGDRVLWWPIPDLHAPALPAMAAFVEDLVGRLRAGASLLVHCGAGIGRAGTTAVCVLVRLGLGLADAEHTVGAARPMAGPEVGAQRELCRAFASR